MTLTDAGTAGGRSRAQAAAQLARASRRATDDRVAAFAVSVEAAERTCATPRPSWPPTWSASPDAVALSGRRAGGRRRAGSGCAATRARAERSRSAGPELPAWLDDALRDAPSGEEPDDRPRPARIVDAHVHLWDPARTDWYPYLSGRQDSWTWATSPGWPAASTCRPTRPRRPGWNVEKLVNVAAATGRHSVDETLELDRRADADGRAPTRSSAGCRRPRPVAEAVELARPADGRASRFRGVRPMGATDGPLPAPTTCSARCRSAAWCSS